MPDFEVHIDGTKITRWGGLQGQVALSTKTVTTFWLLRDDEQVDNIELLAPAEVRIVGNAVSKSTWWVVTDIEDTIIGEGEEAEAVVEVTLTSAEILAEDSIVYPAAGVHYVSTPIFTGTLTSKPFSHERYAGPQEPSFDDSGWSSATQVAAMSGVLAPEGWNTPSAHWIGGTSGYYHGRKTITTSGTFALTIYVAMSNDGELWMDDVLLVKLQAGVDDGITTKTRKVVVQVTDGTHLLYGFWQRIGVADALFGVAAYEANTTTLVAKTDSSWKVSTGVPALNAGSVLDLLISEGQDRGAILTVNPTFTGTDDSKGVDFGSIVGQWPMRVAEDTVAMVLDSLTEGYIEYNMSCAAAHGDLDVWVADGVEDAGGVEAAGAGQVRSTGIEKAVNAADVRRRATGLVKNVGLIVFKDGMIEAPVDSSVTAYGRREVGLSLGQCDGPASIYVAAANLLPVSEPEQSVIATVIPTGDADTPLLGWDLGDWVPVESRTGGTDLERMLGVTFSVEDETEHVTLEPEFGTLRDVFEQRQQRYLNRTNGGTLDGRSRTATPSSPSIERVEIVTPYTDTFATDGSYAPTTSDETSPRAMDQKRALARMQAKCKAAGLTSSVFAIYKNGSSTGQTVTLAGSQTTGDAWFSATPVWDVGDSYSLKPTTAGGHEGVTVTATWVAVGG